MKKLVGTVILGCLMFAMPSYASEATPSEIIEKNSYDVPELTGDWLTDIFAVAWSQEGYMEDDYGNTKYSDWAGQHGRPWCSEFVSWCADQAEIPKNVIPKAASSTAFRNFYSSKGRFYLLDNGRNHEECGCEKASSGVLTLDELRKGDILLIESNDDFSDGADHTEL